MKLSGPGPHGASHGPYAGVEYPMVNDMEEETVL